MKNYLLLFTMCLPAFSPAYTSDTIQVRDIIINEVMFNHRKVVLNMLSYTTALHIG